MRVRYRRHTPRRASPAARYGHLLDRDRARLDVLFTLLSQRADGVGHAAGAPYPGQVIARILVALSLMLLVAAPASERAGAALAAPAAQLELADEPVPVADEEGAAPHDATRAASRACVACPAAYEKAPPFSRVHTRIFRPPRPSLA